ncbi:hypothetical protein TrLO_g13348 [Triparma laevis f. longispina]|uniref:Uncharacterized protein n=1 Tax=Triparma laevis f. longispina TaxID=1714387 RepID=A0A9W7FH91_9STRA|nr:hypothetical protein TrLO_g13348 [Triparma laevis f. longispina]
MDIASVKAGHYLPSVTSPYLHQFQPVSRIEDPSYISPTSNAHDLCPQNSTTNMTTSFFSQGLVHPWKIFMKKVGRVHKHGGVLREIPNDSSWETYWDYYDWLVDSNADDAEVLKHALKGECSPRGTFESKVVQAKNTFEANEDSSIDEYFLVQTPMFWWKRDFVVRRFVKKNEYSFDIIRKSLTSKQARISG